MKTVWMISGNKGGVGKSLFCLALASALDMLEQKYAILDGDGRTGDVFSSFARKCPARLGDFRLLRPDSHNCRFDSEYEGMLHQLLRSSPHLIINTPDGADQVMMKWFDVTLSHTESNNYIFKFIYLMSDRPDGLDMLDELKERFQFLYPVRNLYFGDEKVFSAFNSVYADKFVNIMNFPRLRSDELRLLFDNNTYPLEAIQNATRVDEEYSINTLSKARLFKWQRMFNDQIEDIIDNNKTSNLKPVKAIK